MAKFFQTNDFKELNEQWRKKLNESGFRDIENRLGELKQNANNSYRQADKITREARLLYFQAIAHYAEHDPKLKALEKTVMLLRSEGYSKREIAHKTNIYRLTVNYIIRRCEHAWGMRVWTEKQRKQRDGQV